MINNKKWNYLKFFLLIVLLLVLVILYFFARNNPQEIYIKNNNQNKINNLKLNRIENSELVSKITFNKEETYYNQKENAFYYYLNSKYQGTYKHLYTTIESPYNINYIVNADNYQKKSVYYIDFTSEFEIFVYDKESYFTVKIVFTNVPIINIDVNEEIIEEDSINGLFTFYGKDDHNNNTIINSETTIKIRGGSSRVYPKKSYRLSLFNESGKNKISLLGMREDEDWILDSLYADPSGIRNKISTDLWNQISKNRSYYESNMGCEFLELYLNDEYEGLYTLKEPVDRKSLKLNKTTDSDSGILIKGITYGLADLNKDKKSDFYWPFEIKYPQNIDDYSDYWNVILDKIKDYYYNEINTEEVLNRTFNIDNLIDYRILLAITQAVDNLDTKNLYLSMKSIKDNSKVIHTPWDLDQNFGRNWCGEICYDGDDTSIHNQYNNYNNYDGKLFESNAPEYNSKLKTRYFELRSTVLSINNINSLIDENYDLLSVNAYSKNINKWNKKYNFEEEIAYIKNWVLDRLEYLDQYIGDYNV